jgi:cell division protein FtsB
MSDLELTMMRRVGELKAELANLKTEADRLKAEVERLKDAGEHLWAFAQNCVVLNAYPKTAQEKIDIWNAAVNGKSL